MVKTVNFIEPRAIVPWWLRINKSCAFVLAIENLYNFVP